MDRLNERQLEAVRYDEDQLLVLAGAGSGKTRCVTQKVKNLLESGVSLSDIVAITFTNKAADEMVERISEFKQISRENSNICTFHSFCYRLIRANAGYFGLDRVRICNDKQAQTLLKDAVEVEGVDFPNLHSKIERWKNRLIYPDTPQMRGHRLNGVYRKYQELLHQSNMFDFSDLISQTVLMLKGSAELREKYQEEFKYLIVDEFQDVNNAQFELIKTLHVPGKNKLMIVGDDAQCVGSKTMISTYSGDKNVRDIVPDIDLAVSYKNGLIDNQSISHCEYKYYGSGYKIRTESGKELSLSPCHKIWATNPILKNGEYFVYLMYRKDMGYRIGISRLSGGKGGISDKFSNSCPNQEKATKLWVLDICPDIEDALFLEYKYSLEYGIPTLVFESRVKDKSDQVRINKIFDVFGGSGEYLLRDKRYKFEYPHWSASGYGKKVDRRVVSVVAHSNRYSFIRVEWTNPDTDLLLKGFRFNINSDGRRRLRKHFSNYRECLKYANELSKILECSITEKLSTKYGDIPLFTASQLFVGMKVPVLDKNGELILESIVEKESIEDAFYDLDIYDSSNFFGNGILSHNSIYGFRDSNPSFIINFQNTFPTGHIVRLEQNYRSSETILVAANSVIDRNKTGLKKELWTDNIRGEKISLGSFAGDQSEAQFIARTVRENHARGKRYRDHCVLYRVNSQARTVQDELQVAGIPCQVIHGTSFADRREVQDILAYLKLIDNPFDYVSLRRCAKVPKRGVGAVAVGKVIDDSKLTGDNLVTVMRESPNKAVAKFGGMLTDLSKLKYSAPAFIDGLCESIKYGAYLAGLEGKVSIEERLRSLEKLKEISKKKADNESIEALLERFSLDSQVNEEDADMVRLCTVHSAKGLEWDTVFLIGMNKDIFPHKVLDERDIEEARRLFYVAITRAKTKLYISHTQYNRDMLCEPSSFLDELPREVVEKIGGCYDISTTRQSKKREGYSSEFDYF